MSWTFLDLEMEEIELGERVGWALAVEVSMRRFPTELIKWRLEDAAARAVVVE